MFGTKVLEVKHSKFNKEIKVIKSLGMGTYIQVNGLTQSGGIVESIWKYTSKKIKVKKINRILILGLGGGTVAKLFSIKYPKAKITGVEIDPKIIELGNKYLNLEKYKVNIKIQDAFTFNKGKYDIIIVDIYCGDKYPKKFESGIFLNNIKNLLLKNGVVIFNRLFYKEKKDDAINFKNSLVKEFNKVYVIYPQTNLMIVCKK